MVESVNNRDTFHYSETAAPQATRGIEVGSTSDAYPVSPNRQLMPAEQPSVIDIDLNAPGISLSAIAQYMRELRRTTRLPLDKELQIVEQARQGNLAARQRLIEDRLPYIVHVAVRYHVYAEHEDLLDIIGVANLAVTANLDKALTKQSPAAYLCGVAKREIRTYCRYHSRLMPIKDHRMPSCHAPTVTSFDEQRADIEYRSLSFRTQDSRRDNDKLLRRQVSQALSHLPRNERLVIELRHGIGGQAHSFAHIARILAISPSTVAQRYYRALEQLRTWLVVPTHYNNSQ